MSYALLDFLNDPALCVDSNSTILHANHPFIALFGSASEITPGMVLYEILAGHPVFCGIIPDLKQSIDDVLKSGNPITCSSQKEPSVIGLSIIPELSPGREKDVLSIVIKLPPENPVSVDSHSRQSLIVDEPLFSRLFRDHAHVMLIIDAASHAIIDANDAAVRFYGVTPEQLRSMRFEELTRNSSRMLDAAITEIRSSGSHAFQDRHTRVDGNIRDVEISASLIALADKEVLYCIIGDISERKRIEKALQISRSQLDFALIKSHIGWWTMRLDDKSSSKTLYDAKIFGNYSSIPEWSYKGFLDQVIPEDRPRVDNIIRKAIRKQGSWRFECRVRHPNEKERWVMIIGGFQHDEDGSQKRISGIIMDISERKRSEIELKKSKTRFDLALKAAHAGVWEWDLKSEKHIWSDDILLLHGIGQECAKPSFELWANAIYPDDRVTTLDSISISIQQETEVNIEYRVLHPDGSIHWLMTRGQPVYDTNGFLIRYLGTVIDITERRQLLESVRQSEADYRTLFENIPNGCAYCQMIDEGDNGPNFVFLNVNERFQILTHLRNVIGKRVTDIIPGIRRMDKDLFRIFEKLASNGKTEHFEYYFEALGEWFSVSAYCTKDNYFIVLFDVITKRKQIEQSLRESEHKFRTITEQISEIVFVTEQTGIVSYISPSIEKIAGYRPDEVISHSFYEFLAADEIEKAQIKISNALANHLSSEVFELKYMKKDGAVIYGEVSVRYYHEEKNKAFVGLIGVIRDISQRKKDEATKKQLELQLQRSERHETIGRLAGGIAHEFNNLLSPILGYAELGMVKAAEEGVNSDYYAAILQAAERAKHLTSSVLTFSKVHESAPSVIKVQSIIDEALKLLRPSIPSNIRFEQEIDPTCRNILIDPSRLHQVIVNLCTNAYQAIDKSNGIISISLSEIIPDKALLKKLPELKPKCYVRLSIGDNGIGMNESTIQHIFEPFFTTKAHDKGCGLGLSVVHSIITSYNGTITVESLPGTSTTFHIYLPINEQSIDQKRTEPIRVYGNGTILCIDDEQVILNMITTMLTKIGFEVSARNSPLAALELFRQNPSGFDAVITDLTMPELSGLELATEIKKTEPDIPIILLTGYGKELDNANTIARHGICKILKKPVRLAELVSTINEVINLNQH